jgi:hypothetical protein
MKEIKFHYKLSIFGYKPDSYFTKIFSSEEDRECWYNIHAKSYFWNNIFLFENFLERETNNVLLMAWRR